MTLKLTKLIQPVKSHPGSGTSLLRPAVVNATDKLSGHLELTVGLSRGADPTTTETSHYELGMTVGKCRQHSECGCFRENWEGFLEEATFELK